jgi:hypothetical protein
VLEGLEARQLLSAVVYDVTDTTDNSGDPYSLAGALSAANANNNPEGSLIKFDLGSAPATISLTSTLLVDPKEQLTIQGPGAGQLTITANNSSRVFDCSGGVTAISGLTITGGAAQADLNGHAYGGGVLNETPSTLDLEQCIIAGSSAQTGGGGIANFGNLTLDGGTIRQDSSGSGGGLFNGNTGSATIEGGCTLTRNSASLGGGLFNESTTTFDVTDCTISGDSATTNGGGLYNTGTATVSDGTVTGNSAPLGAGIDNTGTATIEYGCTISDNSATTNGGGLYNTGTATIGGGTIGGNSATNGGGLYNTGTATVSGAAVSGNSAQNGGGIFNTGTTTLEAAATISGNTAGSDGGGLVNEGEAQLNACTISGNLATAGGANNGEGAGLFVASGQSTRLVECTISGNSAQVGSGLAILPNNAGQVSLTHCTIADNSASAQAALWDPLAPVSLTDTIVAGNTASVSGLTDVLGAEVTGSYNLIGTGGSGAIANGSNGNIVLTTLTGLGLAPLGHYVPFPGGAATMALLPGSPALGTGTPISGITTDARGEAIGSSVDIGAFQSQGFSIAIVPTGGPYVAAVGSGFTNPLAVTVKATDFWEPVAGGAVTFAAMPGASGASATLSTASAVIGANGVASVTATANLTLGSYTVSASAAGAVAPVVFELKNLELPTVNLSVSPASPMYGQPVTLVATATGAGVPTGPVTFLEGGTTLGTASLNASGQATLSVSNLPVGANSITAAYGGDTNFASQTSAPKSVTVAREVTKVVLVPHPVFRKKKEVAIALEADIEATYPGAVAPTGSVGYMIKKKALGTATVMAGKATLLVKPRVRLKTVTVVYSGDVDYAPSTMGPSMKTPKAK